MRSIHNGRVTEPKNSKRRGAVRGTVATGAVLVSAAMVMAACGSSGGSGGQSSNTTKNTIPKASNTTTKGQTSPAANSADVYGTLPSTGTPKPGGTISVGQQTSAIPNFIFPVTPAANGSVYTAYDFQNQFWPPLYNGFGPKLVASLGPAQGQPTYSDNGTTVTIHTNPSWKWSNGTPVTGNDVVFDIDLIKAAVKESPANFSNYSPGLFPDNVKSASASGDTVTLHLTKKFNPSYFTEDQLPLINPIPSTAWNIASANGPHLNYKVPANAKKIYDFLAKEGKDVSTFGSNPLWKIVDGPFQISSYNATNGDWSMVANKSYGGSPKPTLAKVNFDSYTNVQTQLTALQQKQIQVAGVDFTQIPKIPSLKAAGYKVYGWPDYGWEGAIYNFKDGTNHFGAVVSQLYTRQAFSMITDQAGYIKSFLKNAGALAYGPVPAIPTNQYTPTSAVNAPYPYDPAKAAQLLKANGWNVKPGGQTTCAKAGTATGDCGAGIPAGTPLKFTWVYGNTPPLEQQLSEEFQSVAKQYLGVDVTLESTTFDNAISEYTNVSAPKNVNKWGVVNFGGFTSSTYPTTSELFNTTGSYNGGSYSNKTADALINASVYGSNPNAVKNEADFLTKNPPVLFYPNPDQLYAVQGGIGGSADGWLSATQYTFLPQYWYYTK